MSRLELGLLCVAAAACGQEAAPRAATRAPDRSPDLLLGCYALRLTPPATSPGSKGLPAGVALERAHASGYELDWHQTRDERRQAREREGIVRRAAILDARGAVAYRAGDAERNHPVWWMEREADSVHVVFLSGLGTTEVVLEARRDGRAVDTLHGRAFDSTANGPPFAIPRGAVVAARQACVRPAT